MRRKQSTTTYPIVLFLADADDHMKGKTGLTPVVEISKNGAAFATAAGAVAEVSDGWYTLAGNATDRDSLGTLTIQVKPVSASHDGVRFNCGIVAFDPFLENRVGGTLAITLTAEAPSGTGIVGAVVELYDSGNTTRLGGPWITDANGEVVIDPQASTAYTVRIRAPGQAFWSATAKTYTVDGTDAIVGTAITISAPSSVDKSTTFLYVDGTLADVVITATLRKYPESKSSTALDRTVIFFAPDGASQYMEAELVRGATYTIKAAQFGINQDVEIDDAATTDLSTLITF